MVEDWTLDNMKALIITESDCEFAYKWSIKELDGADMSEEFNSVCVYDFFNALSCMIDGTPDDFEYYKHEHRAELDLAIDVLDRYDKVILCRCGNILIHDKSI